MPFNFSSSYWKSLALFRTALVVFSVFAWTQPVLAGDGGANLSKALKSGKKTIEFSGKENDSVKIPKGVRVVGSSPDKAVINDDIIMENGSSLENVTVNGNVIPITIAKGASAILINVTVRGGTDAGIFAPVGGGTLVIKNSRILKNHKGIYVLRGKSILLSGNQITGNKEEGVDMHGGIGGSVTGNTFSGNGEGGMEIIIDGSTVTISGNTFSGNASSGLALQNYASGSGKATGKFSISHNSFSGNGNFGIDCKNPQGGGNAVNFRASATATGNTFSANKKGSISRECVFANQAEIPKEDISLEASAEDSEDDDSLEAEQAEEKEIQDDAALLEEVLSQGPQSLFADTLLIEAATFQGKLEAEMSGKNLWKRVFLGKVANEEMLIKKEQARLKGLKNRCVIIESRAVSLEKDISENCTREEMRVLNAHLSAIAGLMGQQGRFAIFSWKTWPSLLAFFKS